MLTQRIFTISACLSILALVPGPTSAQTTATQGPTKSEPAGEVKLFKSPMVLELPIEPFDSLLQKEWVIIEDTARYQCEGVSLKKVRVRAKRQKNGSLGIHVKADTYTIPGEDKWADVLFELIVAGKVVASDAVRDVDAEEETTRSISGYLEVPSSQPSDQAQPVLKVTLTVTED